MDQLLALPVIGIVTRKCDADRADRGYTPPLADTQSCLYQVALCSKDGPSMKYRIKMAIFTVGPIASNPRLGIGIVALGYHIVVYK